MRTFLLGIGNLNILITKGNDVNISRGQKLQVIKETTSICPECLEVVQATIFEEDNVVYIRKECAEHGKFQDMAEVMREEIQKAGSLPWQKGGISPPDQSWKKT